MLILLPAYGRQYKTIEEAEHDWMVGKDFKIQNGPYCSIRDLERMKDMGHAVIIRVNSLVFRLVCESNSKFERIETDGMTLQ